MIFREKLDNIGYYKKIDPTGMHDLIQNFLSLTKEAIEISSQIQIERIVKPRSIIFCGMGGSAISADIATVLLSKCSDIPYIVLRGYNIPNFVSKDDLVFVLSYSGDTEESLSFYDQAIQRTSNIIAITSGGRLFEKSIKNKNIVIKIPQGYPPRASMPYLLVPILFVFNHLFPEYNIMEQLKETLEIILTVKQSIGIEVLSKENFAKQIAKKIIRKKIYIFGSEGGSDIAAYRWKCQFSENSKTNSCNNSFPELNHNEIVNLANKGNAAIVVIILRDFTENEKMKKRIEATKKLLNQNSIEVIEVNSIGKSLLARILSLCYIGDYVSLYLSVLLDVNPMPVLAIDILKKELAE